MDTSEEEIPLLQESIDYGAVEFIDVSEDFVDTISEWTILDGRRILNEAALAIGDDEDVMETEITWWNDNVAFFEEKPDFILTTMLFRAVRNNVLKSRRTRKPALAARDWSKRIEIL